MSSRSLIILLLFGVIFIIGAFLRFHRLATLPAGFFCDEASIGYNAYTLSRSGKDEFGQTAPFFFRAFGEYKSPLTIYFTVPLVTLFSLSEFSTRLPSAIFGLLALPLIFIFLYRLNPSSPFRALAALLGMLILALSPWHLHLTRIAFELGPYIFFLLLALVFFQKSLHHSRSLLFFLLASAAAFYAYFPGRIQVPLFCLPLLIYFFRKPSSRLILFPSLLLVLVLAVPFLSSFFGGTALARFDQISVFAPSANISSPWRHVLTNYLSHFSPEFLFLSGDIDMPGQFITRHSIRGLGELYLWQIPLLLLGLIHLIKQRRYFWLTTLIFWLLIFPLGSAFTTSESAQATRSIIGLIPLTLLSALSVYILPRRQHLFSILPLFTLGSIFTLFSLFQLHHLYFYAYNSYASDYWGWQYGQREIISYFLAHRDSYDDLYSIGQANAPEIFFNFYDPTHLCGPKCQLGDPFFSPLVDLNRRQLFALSLDQYAHIVPPTTFHLLHTVYYPHGQPAFYIGEFTSNVSPS